MLFLKKKSVSKKMPTTYTQSRLRYGHDASDVPDVVDEMEVTNWGWVGAAFLCLVILATLAVSAATLGIVNDYKHKWKSHDSDDVDTVLHELEKRFHSLDDKIDWVKKDLRELDDIEEGLWWINKKLKKSHSRHSGSSGSSEDDHWHHDRKKNICPVRYGEELRFCDPYDGTQGIYNPSDGCPYFFFGDPSVPFVGDDGVITQDFKSGYIMVNSIPFTLSLPQTPAGGLDHVKYLNYQTDPKFVEPKETLRYDIEMSCETVTGDVPFPDDLVTDADKDIRISSCASNAIDFTTAMVFDWFMTGPKNGKEGIKGCFYERLPFLQNCTDPNQPECYHAFSSFNATGTRYKGDKEYLSIEYDRKAGEVRWYDKGELVCSTGNLGTPNPGFVKRLDHGGNDKIVDLNQLSLGYGNFNLLDMANFLDEDSETGLVKLSSIPGFYVFPCETCFYDLDSEESNRLFGEGAKFAVWKSQATIKKH